VVLDALQVTTQPAGVAQAILEYLAAMSADDHGLRFTVLASHPQEFGFLDGRPGWAVHHCPAAEGSVVRKAAFTQWGLPRLLQELRADLLHSMQFITPLRSSCPTVATVHDMVWRLHPETIEQPRRSYYRLMVPRCLRAAAAILTNSEATARDVRRCLPGVASRVQVTPFGTPTWLARQPVAEPTEPEHPYFLFVGTLEPRKNLPNLLGAYARFLAELKGQRLEPGRWPRLVLVGARGWRMKGLDRLLATFPYPDHLQWRDYVPAAELAILYREALALVFPSLYEGFGFPVLEAMSVGLPVMTAGRGAMAEVAGDWGLLVDPLDQAQMARTLHRLHSETTLRETLAVGGRERAARWNWQETVEATLPVYQALTAPRGERAATRK
jgi:glycosyltransferase involved in cell wall biosynthesis